MFQNIKVDIIYYKTNADFELEFNLCGCCRMRLLTDKAPDKKTFIHALSRGVSRSRVIIIAGNLFGNDGIIELVSHAIAKPLGIVNNKMYGIASDERIQIINGATPLVTPEGYFGGCIIESGPQSMILLSDNKNIRKSIMCTLIHPYVEELCAMELKAKAAATSAEPDADAQPKNASGTEEVKQDAVVEAIVGDITDLQDIAALAEPIVPDAPEIPSQSDSSPDSNTAPVSTPEPAPIPNSEPKVKPEPAKSPEITEEINAAKPDAQKYASADTAKEIPIKTVTPKSAAAAYDDGVDLSGGMIFETDEYRAGGKKKKRKEKENDYSSYSDYDDELQKSLSEYMTANDEKQEDIPHGHFASLSLPILIISLLLLIICAILCYCIFYIPASKGVAPTEYLSDTFKILFG